MSAKKMNRRKSRKRNREAERAEIAERGYRLSKEQLDYAHRMDELRHRNLDHVKEEVLRHFQWQCPLHEFSIMPQQDVDLRAYIFFEKDKDIA